MRKFKAFVLPAWLVILLYQTVIAQQKTPSRKPSSETLHQFVENHFAHWDRDHNHVLDVTEVDHVIEDHAVHGRQAALIVSLRYHMTAHGHRATLSHKELLKLVEQHDFVNTVEHTVKHLQTIDRQLFLPTDPELATFHQGRLNDCYLLSAIAAQVHRSPQAIREMIHPEVTGGFQVVFGDGQKIHVPSLTDSELLLGAKLDNRHGSWLAVLEKAYGIIRKRDHAKKGDHAAVAAGTIPTETLNFGNSRVIISLLTGHQAESLHLDGKTHAEQVHNLLLEMTKKKRLLCAGKNKEPGPPAIVNNHAYAILGYDAHERHVHVFNPWGNNFTPMGQPGKSQGYATKNGVFTIPLNEFTSLFSSVVYETHQPLKK
ncbi:C2 family cysteine protease [Schlesneria paludicola]|uniref:C2 family cysteine protease n=1 Tax=Schlesneria paludicola TaxID=360056 RepID=UPI00029A84C6|nr:C2 family cysteine protease [Schlesneria paludicola]